MEVAFLIGRIIIGLFWIQGGIAHFARKDSMIPYTRMKGVPFAEIAVLGTGALLLIAGLSILTGIYPVIAVAALIIFLVPVTFIMHNFWKVEDQMMKMNEMLMFMKNMALLGYTLVLLAIPQPWPLSLGL
jgi:putative oxidoreductase